MQSTGLVKLNVWAEAVGFVCPKYGWSHFARHSRNCTMHSGRKVDIFHGFYEAPFTSRALNHKRQALNPMGSGRYRNRGFCLLDHDPLTSKPKSGKSIPEPCTRSFCPQVGDTLKPKKQPRTPGSSTYSARASSCPATLKDSKGPAGPRS